MLDELGLRQIRCNPDTKKVYTASFDGTQVESWVDDLHAGLVDEEPDTVADWGLKHSKSKFLRAVSATFQALPHAKSKPEYDQFLRCLPALTHWARAMRLALKMRPAAEDYARAQEHLAL